MRIEYARFLALSLAPEFAGPGAEPVFAAELAALCAAYAEGTPATRDFAATMSIPGAAERDFAVRELPLPCGVRVLAHIRFRGGDRTQPFAEVLAQDRALVGDEPLEAVAALAAQFAVFSPRWIRFRDPQVAGEPPAWPAGSVPDMRVFAGDFVRLLRRNPPPGSERIELLPEHPSAYYADYLRIYGELFESRPELVGRVPVETLETLEGFHAHGACFRILADGRMAGVAGARPGTLEGMRGWLVGEEILDRRWWGQRLGPAVQRRLMERLDPARGTLLYGTIDAANIASLKTASRSGRVDATGWIFVPVGAAAGPAP